MREEDFIELIKNPKIIDFLQANSVFLTEMDFFKELQKNKKNHTIYMCHQLSFDYPWSVIAKIADLLNLNDKYHLTPHIVWSDVDTAGGRSKNIAPIVDVNWSLSYDGHGVSLIPKKNRMIEIRFSKIQQEDFDTLIRALKHYFIKSDKINLINQQLAKVTEIYEKSAQNLKSFNYLLSEEMINGYFNRKIKYCLLHNIFFKKQKMFNIIVRNYADYNRIFNTEADTVNRLIPTLKVTEHSEEQLPFFMTCQDDFHRNRLYVKKIADTLYCFTKCGTCHKEIKFNPEELSPENFNYISPDLSLHFYLFDDYAGHVGGISSSLYIVILNKIFKELFNLPTIPTYIPSALLQKPSGFKTYDSIFYNFLML